MKNSQNGIIVPVLIVIVALLVVGSGVYIHKNNNFEKSSVINTETQTTNQTSPINTQNNNPYVRSDKKTTPRIDFISATSGISGKVIEINGDIEIGDVLYFDSIALKDTHFTPATLNYKCPNGAPCAIPQPAEFGFIMPPAELGVHILSVKREDRFSNAVNFQITGHGPKIVSVSPTSASAGSIVTLSGENFSNNYFVQFVGNKFSGGIHMLDVNTTTLKFVIYNEAPIGDYEIYLTNNEGERVESNKVTFKVIK